MSLHKQQFKEWHDRYQGRLLNGITAMVRDRAMAEDVTAKAMSKAWEKRDAFRGESSLDTWITKIARREAFGAKSPAPIVSLDAFEDAAFIGCSEPDRVSDEMERAQASQNLCEALRGLPAIYRQALTDHFLRGRSIKQIARRRRVPIGTVLSRISTAKRLLRGAWEA